MKKGQTSKRGGYEDILFPMEICNITQGDNTGTHKGAYAVDLAGKDTGRDNAYMPFTGVIKAIDSPANGNALFIQSTNKVRFADGTIDYCTVMFVHDNERTGWAVGKTFKQGVQIYTEGTAGKAYGNHIHFEIAKGKFVHMYDLNKYGVYELPNNIPVEKACFMDNTTIKQGIANWKYLKDVKVETSKPSKKPDQVLSVGSVVTSVAMSIKAGIEKINGDDCVNVPALGGYFPLRYLNEYDASDGKKDQYIANDKAKVSGTAATDKGI